MLNKKVGLKKYIERETYSKALKDLISDSDGRTNYEKGYIRGLATANGILLDENQTPTADVVEVVRCKDCKYSRPRNKSEKNIYFEDVLICESCEMADEPCAVCETDFCSYGERKGKEE